MSVSEPIAVRADAPTVLDVPPAHLELVWRPLQARDAGSLFELICVIEDTDKSHERHSADEVVEMFVGDWKDLERDTLGGYDTVGVLRAFAFVEVRPGDTRTVRAFLSGGVHPGWRGRGIGRAVLTWAEGRGRQKLVESGKELPARLAAFVDESARDHRRLYAAAGFSPVRWYTTMRRDLRESLPEVSLPEGVRVVPWTEELDEQVRIAHNETFRDNWGSEPQTPESWRGEEAHFAPRWSFVALDDSVSPPEVVGYAISGRYEQDWDVQGYTCGFTNLLGVRPAWRGKGVAVGLLAAAMAAYRQDGMEYACLGVDTANPTGAHRLYERLGYKPTHGEVLYSVEL